MLLSWRSDVEGEEDPRLRVGELLEVTQEQPEEGDGPLYQRHHHHAGGLSTLSKSRYIMTLALALAEGHGVIWALVSSGCMGVSVKLIVYQCCVTHRILLMNS